jgi:hypothetical protein
MWNTSCCRNELEKWLISNSHVNIRKLNNSNNERTNYPLTNCEKPCNIYEIKYKSTQQQNKYILYKKLWHRECQNIHDSVFQNIIVLFTRVYSLIEIPHGIYFLNLCTEYGPQLAKFWIISSFNEFPYINKYM